MNISKAAGAAYKYEYINNLIYTVGAINTDNSEIRVGHGYISTTQTSCGIKFNIDTLVQNWKKSSV